jgi:asparagine synthetase B (glutamine-hydrolysing)
VVFVPDRSWVGTFGVSEPLARLGEPDAVLASCGGGRDLKLWHGDDEGRLSFTTRDDCAVVMEGALFGRPRNRAAEHLLRAYLARGMTGVTGVRGVFAAIVWDSRQDTLLCLRDQLGVRPLFFAERGGGIVFSPSPDAVAWATGRAAAPNPSAAADWILHGVTAAEETLYEGVIRIPQGHVVEVKHVPRLRRYWHPRIAGADEGDPSPDGALARFDDAFDRAVARCSVPGRTGVFLSGGIDSALVAAALFETARRRGEDAPLAVSIRFPDSSSDEEPLQRSIAQSLGLQHRVVALSDALGGSTLIAAGLEASRTAWHPTTNPWNVAYERAGAASGCEVVLTGEGANDWFEVPWQWTADLLMLGRASDVLAFLRANGRYYGRSSVTYAKPLLWRHGLRPHARSLVNRADAAVCAAGHRQRRRSRVLAPLPAWALPEPELRDTWVSRHGALTVAMRDRQAEARRRLLDNGFTPVCMEWYDLVSRRTGVAHLSPYYDVDLVELALALAPRALLHGGSIKGLAYASYLRRSPISSPPIPRPAWFESVLASAIRAEAPAISGFLGGFPVLGRMGVVDAERLSLAGRVSPDGDMAYHRLWRLFATEAWLQARFV